MPTAKICGLSTPATVRAALDGGAAWLGFMHFARSPRHVSLEDAATLAAPARGRAKVVSVVVDPDDALLERITQVLKPDLIQLHGAESPERVSHVRARTGAAVVKVIAVADAADVSRGDAYAQVADHLMFEGRPPNEADRPGGVGARFDWALLQGRRFDRPHLLAGGLDPWNVGEAITASEAPMVDVSSGVERGAGVKDAALIAAFLDAVRRA